MELDGIIKKLYEDNFSGKLSDERYMIFSRDYENEQHTLKAEVESIKSQIAEQDSKVVNINSFVELARKYTSFEKLTPECFMSWLRRSSSMKAIKAAATAYRKLKSIILSLATWRVLMWSPNELEKHRQRDIFLYFALPVF